MYILIKKKNRGVGGGGALAPIVQVSPHPCMHKKTECACLRGKELKKKKKIA